MTSMPAIGWSREDPLGYLTGAAWTGLFASFLFNSLLADSRNIESTLVAAHFGAFVASHLSWGGAWGSWSQGSRKIALALVFAPWLAIGLATALARTDHGAALSASAGMGALAATSIPGPSTWSYWLMLALASAHFAQSPTPVVLSVLLAVAAICALGLLESNARAVLQRYLRRRAGAQIASIWRQRRVRVALPTALTAMGVALATLGLVARGLASYRAALDEASQREQRAADPERTRESESLAQWMHSISLGSAPGERTDEVLAHVALREAHSGKPVRDGRVLYFPVTTLDQFGADRMSRSTRGVPQLFSDADDGTEDGWLEFARPHPLAPLVTATVTQSTALTARAGLAPLVRLEPLLAVRIDELSRLEDGTLLAQVEGERLEYALAADPRLVRLAPEHGGRAAHEDRRYLELPSASPSLARIVQRANEVTGAAGSDAERALAIVAHFRDGYSYEDSDGATKVTGLESLARVLERRSGYCATIAATCVLMLRSQGIPSRAVAGLLGSEFDAESARYVLRQRHGHAWVEAHFEGLGWVQLEPTPPDARARPSRTPEFDPLADWSERAVGQLVSFVRGDGDAPGAAQLATLISEGPATLARSAREGQPLGLAAASALLLTSVFVVARALRGVVKRARAARTSAGRALAFEERLIEALRARGAQVRASRTLREIAHSAAARIEAPLEPALRRAIRTLEAARFGGEELGSLERRELEQLLAQLSSSGPRG